MKIAILKERRPHETRVAATPETVKKLKALGAEEIVIEFIPIQTNGRHQPRRFLMSMTK